jgi:asparagine synthetase B (glutamine-hydrolysing)
MPGIFGILELKPQSVSEEEGKILFNKMAAVLRHHDDDLVEQEYISGLNLLIGRIGSPGQNPLGWPIYPDGKGPGLQIFASGPLFEIDPDIPKRDLSGTSAIRHTRGFFSAALVDPFLGTTLIVADHRASFPIYYAQTENQLLFAPEVKALLASHLVQKEIDLEAFATFLAQGYLLGDETLFKSVRRLRGGELLRVENGRVVKETYWRFAPGSVPDRSTQSDLEQELGQLLNAAVRKHIGEPEKTIIFLSGGVDSRGILGGALESVHGSGERLNTVSWGASQRKKNSDVELAALIARDLHTNHRFMQRKITDYREYFTRVNYLIDGLSDISAFHPYEHQIMVELRESGYERALRGDEVFGWSLFASTHEGAFSLANLRRLHNVGGLAHVIQEAYYDELCNASDAAVEKALSEAGDLAPNQAKDFFYFTHRLQCYLQTASYYKQVELDQRNVLLDDSILDFLAKVPEPLRIDKMLYRNVVNQAYPRLARFPFAKRANLEDWRSLLSNESPVREYALDEFKDRSSGIWEFLDPLVLTQIVKNLERKHLFRSILTKRIKPKSLLKQGITLVAPGLLTKTQAQRRARPAIHLGADNIIMRSLVLKNWYDTFVQ